MHQVFNNTNALLHMHGQIQILLVVLQLQQLQAAIKGTCQFHKMIHFKLRLLKKVEIDFYFHLFGGNIESSKKLHVLGFI